MATKTIQCSQAGCMNTFAYDDALDEDAAGAAVGGWSKASGQWVGCSNPGGCCMVPPPPALAPALKKRTLP